MNELLTLKELAFALKRSRKYVWFMRQSGFPMPGNRATLEAALKWLAANPNPCQKRHHRRF